MSKAIGIDLGTTNSVVAVMEGDAPRVIVNQEGARTTPSVVAFTRDGEKLVGQMAKRQAVVNPTSTVFSIKRFIGARYENLKHEADAVPYKVKAGNSGQAVAEIQGKDYSPQEISASVLRKLKESAEAYLGATVKDAVITVPAYFNDAQRQATKDAGVIAGLNVLRIINEPTAASLAYSRDHKKEQKIAVFDFGGGTFDISILEVSGDTVEVLATNGNTHLGGDNIDELLVKALLEEFKKTEGVDLSSDAVAMQRLREAAERAKVELSSTGETEVNLPFLTATSSGPKHFSYRLSRSRFQTLVEGILEKTLEPCRQVLKDAHLEPKDIDEVVLVGGSTRIPYLQEKVEKFFGRKPNCSVNPDEAVALGAAIQAGVLTGAVDDILLLDVTPLSLGVEIQGGAVARLIERNTTIPTKRTQTFSNAADNQTQVEIHIVQGERPLAANNASLGRFSLEGIPPVPRGTAQIEVSFDLDANGILRVSAVDKGTGKKQEITIEGSSGLKKEDVERLVREAETYAEEDKSKRELVDLRNSLDNLTYSAGKLITENEGKLVEADKLELADKARLAKNSLDSNLSYSKESLERIKKELEEVLFRAASNLQKASAEAPATPPAEDVIDADFSKE